MPFASQTYRVMIASPGDLVEERQVATDAINDWNATNSTAEGTVLLPVKWETHAVPETGLRPQEVIDRQLVDTSDLLIGLFWTRFGTSTGVAASGTVEEIDLMVEQGKPAMLYFSKRPIDPSKINIEQHRMLRDFQDATYHRALVGTFVTLDELRSKLLHDLTQQVRKLNGGTPGHLANRPIEEAREITALILEHKEHGITLAEFKSYRDAIENRRMASQVRALAVEIRLVEDKVDHEFLRTEESFDWLSQVVDRSVRTGNEDKLRALRRVFIQGITAQFSHSPLKEIILRHVSDMTSAHIAVLRYLTMKTQAKPNNPLVPEGAVIPIEIGVARNSVEGVEPPDVDAVMSDLINLGILEYLNSSGLDRDPTRLLLTPFGWSFVTFMADPGEPPAE